MKSIHFVTYLFGGREAIGAIARDRTSIPVGLFLAATAGVAREYDRLDLTQVTDPFLTGPIVACVLTLLLMHCIRDPLGERMEGDFSYFSLLGLVLMTSPLAWAYALPVEAWLDPVAAAKANLVLLSVVSLWRVALIIRVLHVLTGASLGESVLLALTPAAILMGMALFAWPTELVAFMSGLSRQPADVLLRGAAGMIQALGACLALLGCGAMALVSRGKRKLRGLPADAYWGGPPLPALALVLALWALLLPAAQERIRRSVELERAYVGAEWPRVVELVRFHPRADFAWRLALPPWPGADQGFEKLGDLLGHDGFEALSLENWFPQHVGARLQELFDPGGSARPYIFYEVQKFTGFLASLRRSRHGRQWARQNMELITSYLEFVRAPGRQVQLGDYDFHRAMPDQFPDPLADLDLDFSEPGPAQARPAP